MKKKGFTLVEMIAVILILAIIFLITTPVIRNYLNNSKRNMLKLSAEGFARTALLNQTILEGELFQIEKGILKNSGNEQIETNEGNNENGEVYVCKSGRTAIILTDEKKKYCAKKNTDQTKAKVYDYSESVCTIEYDIDC